MAELSLARLVEAGSFALQAGVGPAPRTVPFEGTTTVNLNLRLGPSTDTDKVGLVPNQTPITVLEVRSGWFRIGYGDLSGWVNADYVRLPINGGRSQPTRSAGADRVLPFQGLTTDTLNLRAQPGMTAKIIGFLPPRRKLTVYEQRPNWFRIESDDLRGWVASRYVRVLAGPQTDAPERPNSSPAQQSAVQQAGTEPTVRAEAELQRLRLENSRLARELAESQALVRRVQTSSESLQQRLIETREHIARDQEARQQSEQATEQELAALKAQLASVSESKKESRKEVRYRPELKRLRSDLEARNQLLEELERRFEAVQAGQAEAEEARNSATQRSQELEDQLVRVAEELKAAQADIEGANVALRAMHAENSQLRTQLAAVPDDPPEDLTPLEPLNQPVQPISRIPIEPLETSTEPVATAEDATAATTTGEQTASRSPGAKPTVEPTAVEVSDRSSQRDASLSTIAEAIERWRKAWSSRDVEGYLAAYSPGFRPQGMTLAAWKERRRQRISGPSSIEVEVGTLRVKELAAGTARVSFAQTYRSNTYSDQVQKVMVLERNAAGEWLILTEVAVTP